MRLAFRLFTAAIFAALAGRAASAADQPELDSFYTSKLVGEPLTLDIGLGKKHTMRRFELSATDGTSFAGTTTAICNQIKVEDTSTTPSNFSYEAYCTWKDGDGDLIFES